MWPGIACLLVLTLPFMLYRAWNWQQLLIESAWIVILTLTIQHFIG